MNHLQFPEGLGPASFIQQFWQKRPLLMRGALPELQLSLSPDELAWLALQPDVEARLVCHDRVGQYTLSESPFAESDLMALPDYDWTLLVQDVDKHLPEFAAFADLFNFLPAWRFDDLMVSVAAPGGGVGPHVDQYDVFLCQLTGHRRWLLGEPGDYAERRNSPLRQIGNFKATSAMTLGPGDLLYLPPGVPHDGTAENLCTTWSVGFRAPSQADLAADLEPGLEQEASEHLRYSDADLTPDEVQDGLISGAALARFRNLLGKLLDMDDRELLVRLGQYLTRPKPWLQPEPADQTISAETLRKRLSAGETLLRHGMAVFARGASDQGHWLFASGETIALEMGAWPLAQLLCSRRSYPISLVGAYLDTPDALGVLTRLYNEGQLLLDGDL